MLGTNSVSNNVSSLNSVGLAYIGPARNSGQAERYPISETGTTGRVSLLSVAPSFYSISK